MKKSAGDEEKERRKREKKLRKEAKGGAGGGVGGGVTGSMSSDELLRLEEVRRSLKIRGRRKEKEKLPSGITGDYSADFFAALNNADAAAAGGANDGVGNGNGSAAGPEQDRGNEEIVASVMTHIESRTVASNGAGIGININYGEVTHSLLSGGLKVRHSIILARFCIINVFASILESLSATCATKAAQAWHTEGIAQQHEQRARGDCLHRRRHSGNADAQQHAK